MKFQIHNLLILSFLTSLAGCDFTPRLHKEIIDAQEKLSTHHYSEAADHYEKILKGNPPADIKLKIYYQLGELNSIHLSNNDKAISYFNLLKKKAGDPVWKVKAEEKMGEINFVYRKKFQDSLTNYKVLTGFRPHLPKYQFYEYRLALSYFNLNKYDEAEEIFGKVSKETNHEYYVKSFYYLGLSHFQQKEWKGAIEEWKKYIVREKRRDDVVQTKFLMANAYETMEELKRAYDLYYSIIGEYPNTKVIKSRLNTIYERRIARKR